MSPKKPTADQTAADIFEDDPAIAAERARVDAAIAASNAELSAMGINHNDLIDQPDEGDVDTAMEAQRDRQLGATADQLADANDPLSQLARFHAADAARVAGIDQTEAASDDEGDGTFFIDMRTADEAIKPMIAGTRAVVSCTAAEAKLSASGGNPMIAVRVKVERIVSVPDATIDTSTYRNRAVRDNLLFTTENPVTGSKGQLWRCKLAFDAFGVEWDTGVYRTKAAFLAMLTRKAEELIGNVCEIELGVDANDGSGGQKVQIDTRTGAPYSPKNTIARYFPYKPVQTANANNGPDDDLPF